MGSLHKNLTGAAIHIINAFTHADEGERLSEVTLDEDIGKVSRQTDIEGYFVLVDSAPTWKRIDNEGNDQFTELTDTPSSYSGEGTKIVQVNAGETALEFNPFIFDGLTDTPSSKSGEAMKVLRVNLGETALEYSTAGSGDVAGPASSVVGSVPSFFSTTGKILQDPNTMFIVGGSVGIGGTPDASAILDLTSASKGFSPPSMTEAERDNISFPVDGLIIHNITDDELNVFFTPNWLAIQDKPTGTVEDLQFVLALGNTTSGNDIVISNGDSIVSTSATNADPINIIAGFGSNIGGTVTLQGGDSDSTGGDANVIAGNGPAGQGGNINLTVRGGGSDTFGGFINLTAGAGGTNSGPGGGIFLTSGASNSDDENSGDIRIEAPPGGQFADQGFLLLQRLGGNVGIGTSSPATLLDIQSNSPVVTVRNLADFGRSEISLYGSRNSGAGTATVAHINGYNTRSGSDIVTSRIAFANGITGTSAGSLQFLTRENADSGLSVRMVIDDAGRVTINGEDASRVAPDTVEIFTSSDFDALATAGVITVDGVSLSIIFKDSITSTNRFNVINGGRLTLRFDAAWTYSGTGTALTVATGGTLNVKDGAILGNSSATLFDVIAASTVSFSNNTVLFFGEYGTIRETANVLMSTNGFFVGDGSLSLIDNASTAISSWGLASATAVSGALIRVSGLKTGFFDFSASNITLQSGESFIRFDPSAPILQATIDNVRAVGGELFDTTGGTTGGFTVVADAAVALTTIDSVTDSSGVARFNFTVGPTMFVDQEVDITNFVTETSYNQTGIITSTGAGFFEIASIAFTDDDTTGDFSSNSITITDIGTTLSDGDTLVIDTDGASDYDGGATVYNQLTNSFQINRTFTTTHTGSWDTSGIDQTDPRVLASNNAGFVDSKYIATAFVNDNSTANGAIVNNTFTDMVFGTGGSALVAGSTIERWKLVDELNGTFEYTGNEPFDGFITFDFTVISSGGAQDFRFKWLVDSGSGFGDLDDNVEALVNVGSSSQSISKTFPLKCVKGCQLKPQITRNSGTSGITTSFATIYATQ